MMELEKLIEISKELEMYGLQASSPKDIFEDLSLEAPEVTIASSSEFSVVYNPEEDMFELYAILDDHSGNTPYYDDLKLSELEDRYMEIDVYLTQFN